MNKNKIKNIKKILIIAMILVLGLTSFMIAQEYDPEYIWDEEGNLIMINNFGTANDIAYIYWPNGAIKIANKGFGREVYFYDENGNILGEKYGEDLSIVYTYDDFGRIISEVSYSYGEYNYTNYTYDSKNRVLTQDDDGRRVIEYVYDEASGNIININSIIGNAEYEYSGDKLVYEKFGEIIINYAYDEYERLTDISYLNDVNSNIHYEYDEYHTLIKSSNKYVDKEYLYSINGRLMFEKITIKPDNFVMVREHYIDAKEKIVRSYVPQLNLGKETKFDSSGEILINVKEENRDMINECNFIEGLCSYENKILESSPSAELIADSETSDQFIMGDYLIYEYNDLGEIKKISLDKSHNVVQGLIENADALDIEIFEWIEYEYNDRGKVVLENFENKKNKKYFYDSDDNLVKVIDKYDDVHYILDGIEIANSFEKYLYVCRDFDENKGEFEHIVRSFVFDDEEFYNDECINDNQLREYYCDQTVLNIGDKEVQEKIVDCDYGCFLGKCLTEEEASL